MNDLRHAVRRLVRAPGFTVAAVLSIAPGIGATPAVFVINALLPPPLAAQHEGQIGRGVALFEAGRYDEAESELRAVLGTGPSHEAHFYLGRILHLRHDHDAAEAAFRRAADLAPETARYHFWIGRTALDRVEEASLLRKLGHARRARRALEEAVRLDPEDVEARSWLGNFFFAAPGIAGGDKQRAWEEVDAVRRLDPTTAHRMAGTFLWREGRLEEALREYELVTRSGSVTAQDEYSLGRLHQELEDHPSAVAAFERAILLDPEHWSSYYQLGRTASVSGTNLEAGAEALVKYITGHPELEPAWLATAYWRLGLIRELQGDAAAAGAEYERALRADPGHRESREALERLRRP